MIKLQSVYRHEQTSIPLLYELLKERDLAFGISHKKLPTPEEHENFVKSNIYQCWYWIQSDGDVVGSIYLSKQREIGIQIFKAHQGKGYGTGAVEALMKRWPGKFYANIHPKNTSSIKFFERIGLKQIQVTYAI